ncbi:hypothetical protein DFH27DRAFT_559837 [Peziza echinospora]|nr:hypothetical protein DFH27DRAFT_559837 [Peziza echinospora]
MMRPASAVPGMRCLPSFFLLISGGLMDSSISFPYATLRFRYPSNQPGDWERQAEWGLRTADWGVGGGSGISENGFPTNMDCHLHLACSMHRYRYLSSPGPGTSQPHPISFGRQTGKYRGHHHPHERLLTHTHTSHHIAFHRSIRTHTHIIHTSHFGEMKFKHCPVDLRIRTSHSFRFLFFNYLFLSFVLSI